MNTCCRIFWDSSCCSTFSFTIFSFVLYLTTQPPTSSSDFLTSHFISTSWINCIFFCQLTHGTFHFFVTIPALSQPYDSQSCRVRGASSFVLYFFYNNNTKHRNGMRTMHVNISINWNSGTKKHMRKRNQSEWHSFWGIQFASYVSICCFSIPTFLHIFITNPVTSPPSLSSPLSTSWFSSTPIPLDLQHPLLFARRESHIPSTLLLRFVPRSQGEE